MIQLGSRSGPALRLLWKYSALAGHPMAGPALDTDRMTLDVERLTAEGWAWSSGELVLINLALCIATGYEACSVAALSALDEPNRRASLDALSIWLGVTLEGAIHDRDL